MATTKKTTKTARGASTRARKPVAAKTDEAVTTSAPATTGTAPAKRATVKKPTTRKAPAKKPATAKARTKAAPKAPATPSPAELKAEAAALAAPKTSTLSTPAPVQGVTREVPAETETATSAEARAKLFKRDLIERVIASSGVKPRFVRQVTEALLDELGAMAAEADTLQLPPLGTVKVQRRKQLDNGEVLVCKIRRKKASPDANDPLAAAAE